MVIYVRRQQLDFFVPSGKQLFSLPFSPEVVADVSILKPEEYKKAVSKCLAQHKIEKHKVLLVLAKEVCFVKPVVIPQKTTDPTQVLTTEEQVKQMRDSMPYGNVYARAIKFPKEQTIVAVNRDFFEPLLEILKTMAYDVTTLVPELAVDMDLTQSGLTAEIGQQLARSVDRLESFDLLENEEKPRQFITATATPEEKKRTWLLAVVFLCLLLVLGVVYWYVSDADAKERARRTSAPVAPTVAPVASPAPTTLLPVPVTTPVASAATEPIPAASSTSPEATASGGVVQGVGTSFPGEPASSDSANPITASEANSLQNELDVNY